MEQISDFCGTLCILCLFTAPIALLTWIVLLIKKSAKKKIAMHLFFGALLGLVLFTAIGVATSPMTRCEHEWEHIEKVAATCTESGTSIKHCSLCGAERTDIPIASKGHTWIVTQKAASCENEGTITRTCKECACKETKTLPAKGHSFTEVIVQEPDCANEGLIEKTCTTCNKVENKTIAKVAHHYEITSIIEASLEAPGVEESTCSVCGDIKQKEFAKLGTKSNPGSVTVEQLVSEIYTNIDAAKTKYNDQWIEITGKVLDADNIAGMTRFYLYGKSGDSGLRIICWVNEETLKPFEYQGEFHTFLGQVREITTFNATEIGDCQIVSE